MATNGKPNIILKNPNGEMDSVALRDHLGPLATFLAVPEQFVEAKQSRFGVFGLFGSKRSAADVSTPTPAAKTSTSGH